MLSVYFSYSALLIIVTVIAGNVKQSLDIKPKIALRVANACSIQ
jgi:hypothetical protein